MKKKSGFVFVETIVVCSVLAISLVTIYASFALLVNEQKKRNKYDQAIYNYRLYNIAKELDDSLGNCNNYEEKTSILNFGEEAKKIYYVSADNIADVPNNEHYLSEYVKTISPANNTCLLIGEFEIKNPTTEKLEYYYSHVTIERNG